jgi:hypothetical protein
LKTLYFFLAPYYLCLEPDLLFEIFSFLCISPYYVSLEPDLLFENTGATFSCFESMIWAGARARARAGKRGRDSGN